LHVIDNRGKTPKTTNNKSLHPIIEVAQIANSSMWIDTNACLKFVDDITYNSFFRNGHLKENDVLISTVGTIGVAGFNFIDGLSIAQNVVALRSEYSYLIYCYLILNKEMIINLDIGGVQPSIKLPHLLEQYILIPNDYNKEYYNKMFETIKNINLKNNELKSLKQTYLKKFFG